MSIQCSSSYPDGQTAFLIVASDAILELSRDEVPLRFELFEASSKIAGHLDAIAVEVAAIPFSLNDEVDILTVIMNATTRIR